MYVAYERFTLALKACIDSKWRDGIDISCKWKTNVIPDTDSFNGKCYVTFKEKLILILGKLLEKLSKGNTSNLLLWGQY